MKTKYSPIMKDLETRQEQSRSIHWKLADIIGMATKAGYQSGDAAFDLLKKAGEAFLADGNATHSSAEAPE